MQEGEPDVYGAQDIDSIPVCEGSLSLFVPVSLPVRLKTMCIRFSESLIASEG